MKSNKIGFFGFFGLLGFLGFVTDDPMWFLQFSFFSAFSAFIPRKGVVSDERVEMNINRAARNAFVFMMVAATFSLAYISVFGVVESFVRLVFYTLHPVGLSLFVLSLLYYDTRGN